MRRPQRRAKGGVYERKDSGYWYLTFTLGGIKRSEKTDILVSQPGMTKEATKRQALAQLEQRLSESARCPVLTSRNVTVADLAEDYITEYTVNGRKSLGHAKSRWEQHLKPFFGVLKAAHVSGDLIERYKLSRLEEKASNATVNRELAALRRMFRLGRKRDKITFVPVIECLKENNVRKGFIEDATYEKLIKACTERKRGCGLWLRAIVEFAYTFGWRKSEVLGLRVSQIDLLNRTIRLEVGSTKNGQGREVSMTGSIYALVVACVTGKAPEAHVFTRPDGKAVRDFRKAWENVCEAAECPGLLFHDLRRCGVRNRVRSGVTEKVAMTITGHQTRSVFDRYNIVSQSDIADAMGKLEASREAGKKQHLGYVSATIPPVPTVPVARREMN